MSKILLTWRASDQIKQEIVTIVPDGVPIVDENGNDISSTTEMLDDHKDLVFYMEEDGNIFCLRPDWIISVEPVDDNTRMIDMPYNENPSTKESVMNTVKKMAQSTKNFVSNHKVGIAVVTTALAVGALQRSNMRTWNQFLDDKGLTDEYYNNY